MPVKGAVLRHDVLTLKQSVQDDLMLLIQQHRFISQHAGNLTHILQGLLMTIVESDIVIIGGGVVGLSIAYGLLKKGLRVVCIDGSDIDLRASRGNFGLVWVQGKGVNCPPYASWTLKSAKAYRAFVDQLMEESGLEIDLQQNGGYEYFLDHDALMERSDQLSSLKDVLGDYPYETLTGDEIRQEESMVGPLVAGATFFPHDGHVNPLQLLKALLIACQKMGLDYRANRTVTTADYVSDHSRVYCDTSECFVSERVVLSAGLGAKKLGPIFGFKGYVRPQRGQVLVTEKFPPLLRRPSVTIRQVNEGAIQIGDSKEEVGYDDHETLSVVARIAERAVKIMPSLASARLVRTWGALRVMSPDGLPIYEHSTTYPNAVLVTCHSGISLAANHGSIFSDWILGADFGSDFKEFGEARFATASVSV
jgi:glycine/D-amino acid oxidase-like deaminating enzyme